MEYAFGEYIIALFIVSAILGCVGILTDFHIGRFLCWSNGF